MNDFNFQPINFIIPAGVDRLAEMRGLPLVSPSICLSSRNLIRTKGFLKMNWMNYPLVQLVEMSYLQDEDVRSLFSYRHLETVKCFHKKLVGKIQRLQ